MHKQFDKKKFRKAYETIIRNDQRNVKMEIAHWYSRLETLAHVLQTPAVKEEKDFAYKKIDNLQVRLWELELRY